MFKASGSDLHIVYNLVSQTLGGTIEVVSRPNEGMQVSILFPRVRPPEASPRGNMAISES